jgi:hypothetical protein
MLALENDASSSAQVTGSHENGGGDWMGGDYEEEQEPFESVVSNASSYQSAGFTTSLHTNNMPFGMLRTVNEQGPASSGSSKGVLNVSLLLYAH